MFPIAPHVFLEVKILGPEESSAVLTAQARMVEAENLIRKSHVSGRFATFHQFRKFQLTIPPSKFEWDLTNQPFEYL